MKLFGYRRPDGKIGIRNHVLILPSSMCASETCRMISMQVDGTVPIPNQNGCGQVPKDLKMTVDVLVGLAANPNVYGTVLVGLGCEAAIPREVERQIREHTNKPLYLLIIQEEGGTPKTIKKGVAIAEKLVKESKTLERVEFDMSELILATQCGGSDPTSGIAANPAVGNLCDRVVNLGGTVLMTETTEFVGAERVMAKQAINEEVGKQIYKIVNDFEYELNRVGASIREGNPVPGNFEGGITTLEEKSLGCVLKGGTTPIMEVIGHAQTPTKKGLIVQDTPGHDFASISSMVAGGAQLVVFTTGRGTPSGNGIVPVMKITANHATFENMKDNLDFDASSILDGSKTVEQVGEELFNEVVEIINGKKTKPESFGFNEFGVRRFCCNT